ncbi:MAG: hypothetical protein LBD73_06340 [Deferribacteraceae bacterium]|jgi:hypothetical protein|nr:hypothetical protein [Deferribacteraceae bacterium]
MEIHFKLNKPAKDRFYIIKRYREAFKDAKIEKIPAMIEKAALALTEGMSV